MGPDRDLTGSQLRVVRDKLLPNIRNSTIFSAASFNVRKLGSNGNNIIKKECCEMCPSVIFQIIIYT